MKMRFLAFLCCACLLLSACAGQTPAVPTETASAGRGRWLDISAEVVAEGTKPTTDLTVPGSERTLSYKGLIEPKILIDGSYIPLEEAVENGQITPEQVVCYASWMPRKITAGSFIIPKTDLHSLPISMKTMWYGRFGMFSKHLPRETG